MKNRFELSGLVALATVLVVIACATTGGTPFSDISVISGYQNWHKVNAVTLSGDPTGSLRGVHLARNGLREIYVNPVGEAVSIAGGEDPLPYPEGTVLLKETFKDVDGKKGKLTDIFVMVKRDANYNPENNNWEYIRLNSTGKITTQGTVAMCIECHQVD
ncbi:MAG: hypothetical protein CVV51_00265 [Spirochaetae bacterium HGW-Spirochaetae-7]|jgi:hypothetical protein|nr:MAG: hypothetical protein CVV51_00265 [Spirochaetae bacterium HGW-Spirochaetae-7]